MRVRSRRRCVLLAAAALFWAGSGCRESKEAQPRPGRARAPAPPAEDAALPRSPAPAGRTPMVPEDHPLYRRVEGTDFSNDCEKDGDCRVGGCSGEVCSAEEGVQTTCEARSWPTEGGRCGCVRGQCVWYRSSAGEPARHR